MSPTPAIGYEVQCADGSVIWRARSEGVAQQLADRHARSHPRCGPHTVVPTTFITVLGPERITADCPTCGTTTAVVSDARTARQAASTCCSSTTEKTKP